MNISWYNLSVIAMKRFSRIELVCIIVFLISSMLCILWFFLYTYFATPKLTLNGKSQIVIKVGDIYYDEGAKATLDGKDISKRIITKNNVNINKVGVYKIEYSVTNNKGKRKTTIMRTVKVHEYIKPEIKLISGSPYNVQFGSEYKDPGYVATDNNDGDISNRVIVTGNVDTSKIGKYKLYYTVSDFSENTITKMRTINVVDTEAPKIKLNGKKRVAVKLGKKYKDKGFTAIDNYDGDISDKVQVSNQINYEIAGIYQITYKVTDSFGNTSKTKRTIQVGTKQDIDNQNYILVSISDQKLWFYKKGKLQLTSAVVTGQSGEHDTPRGTYRIQYKATDIYLRGPDYKTFVNYWMPFNGEYGLHDALWRNSFGGNIYSYNGSHGCVNLPYSVAERIFYEASVGFLVKVY